jgi:hypothetical protein
LISASAGKINLNIKKFVVSVYQKMKKKIKNKIKYNYPDSKVDMIEKTIVLDENSTSTAVSRGQLYGSNNETS